MPTESTQLQELTPYPEVNQVLSELLNQVQSVLGAHFSGLYLYGSLASGDFNPGSSDIDFVVITQNDLPEALIPALHAMHVRLAARGLKWAAKLEGSYLPEAALRRYDPAGPPRPTLNEGAFYLAPHGSDWVIQRHILREWGVTLAGPSPQGLIDPVSPDALRYAVLGVLTGWWEPMLAESTRGEPSRLERQDYQAYAILSMCRAMYTLEKGEILSKPACARWAQQALTDPTESTQWRKSIQPALEWTYGAPLDLFEPALEAIRSTVDRAWALNEKTHLAHCYPCLEYIADGWAINGWQSSGTSGRRILPASQIGEITPAPGENLLIIGQVGSTGDPFGYRRDKAGLWTYAAQEKSWRQIAETLREAALRPSTKGYR